MTDEHPDVTVVIVPAWHALARCQYAEPDMFFPEKGGSTHAAKRVCADCPVRPECLEYALDNEERFGIWGGYSERERRKMRVPQVREEVLAHEYAARDARELAAGGDDDDEVTVEAVDVERVTAA